MLPSYNIGERKLRLAKLSYDRNPGRTSPGKDRESNWLPSDKNSFYLFSLGMYLPGEEVLNGAWAPPPVIPQVKPEVYKKLGYDLESSDNAARKSSSEELSYCLFMAILISAS
ncbi:MAG: hypothetical protein WA364_24355 [Candidatus Nitrosopolaris sp.]